MRSSRRRAAKGVSGTWREWGAGYQKAARARQSDSVKVHWRGSGDGALAAASSEDGIKDEEDAMHHYGARAGTNQQDSCAAESGFRQTFPQGLKRFSSSTVVHVRAEARTLQSEGL